MRISDWSSDVCSSDLPASTMRDDCGVPSWRPCCETGASARLCGGLWGAGSCWHLHVFSVGHVWEADLYPRSEEHTSELQSLMRISYAVFCLQKKKNIIHNPLYILIITLYYSIS